MSWNDRSSHCPSADRGFRLHKLEVLNWGTFDGEVFAVRPGGNSALLIGQNGSGKSTLVDALLTLLVRPNIRNFNVAAGAKKRERDEKSYLRGAYDRGSDESGQGIQVKCLRPGSAYSVILAYFHNTGSSKSFTVAQLLYLNTDQSLEKIYCLADDERSIKEDFQGLQPNEAILKSLQKRGFRATRKFADFEAWFAKRTHVKSKAMEVFNQTVAVKDIHKLNDFIRDHMLESSDRNTDVEELLGHYVALQEAHESLVRVRQQRDLLEPIARLGGEYQQKVNARERIEGLLAALDVYFSRKHLELFAPALTLHQEELASVRQTKDHLAVRLNEARDTIRQLKNEIDQVGGERLRQLPNLIRLEKNTAEVKRRQFDRWCAALQIAMERATIASEAEFTDILQQLPVARRQTEQALAEESQHHEQQTILRGQLRRELSELEQELKGLEQRRENIPQWCVALRDGVCGELGLSAKDFPFAAELIQVRADEHRWEASIEMVLRNFALSLLVPDRHYSLVARYLDQHRLSHSGRGQRLVYFRVTQAADGDRGAMPGPKSLFRKLDFRDGHPLLPWLKVELAQRFDFACCEEVEEFRHARGSAMTPHRHVKSAHHRHEKDDRDHVSDPRNFVLGWDNREKKQRLAAEIQRVSIAENHSSASLAEIAQTLDGLRNRLNALTELQRVASYTDIDFATHEREIANLDREKQVLESGSDAIRALQTRLAQVVTSEHELQEQRDQTVARENDLHREIVLAEKILAEARATLDRSVASGEFPQHEGSFSELDAQLAEPPLTTANVFRRKDEIRKQMEAERLRIQKSLDPLQGRLADAMVKFLRVCPENANDLHSSVEYLESFLELKRRIEADDLPRHEQRFRERLNQKVIEHIGVFRNSLERERRAIEEKIESLNLSLQELEYRPDTHIQLEPRPVRDPEIVEFKEKLRECIEGSFDDSAESNEARFVRIRDLLLRLGDESNRRWRDKVTDVRRWFDFVAAVIDRNTNKTLSVYQDSSGQSGGEKAKLAFTILVAAIAYQYDLDPKRSTSDRFHFVVVDEMFSKVDDRHAEYALDLFKQFGLQLLIVAPLDAKARITQPYVGSYLHVVKQDNRSAIFEMTAREFEESVVAERTADFHVQSAEA